MPTEIKKPCRHPGCRAYASAAGYCADHQIDRRQSGRLYDQTKRTDDPALAEAKRIRSSARWTQFSRQFKSANPTCCDPFKNHGEFAPLTDQAHHVQPLAKAPELAFEWGNLRGLCVSCHRRVEGMERRGESTAQLFAANAPTEPGFGFA